MRRLDFPNLIGESVKAAGGVRSVSDETVTIYVENSGDFIIPASAVESVHDGKVILNPAHLTKSLLEAVGNAHNVEDPALVG